MSVTKKKILLITPSRIIARGITSILEEHGGFTVETVLTDLSRENEATVRDSMADIVIVDPIIFDFASRPAGRSRISDLTDAAVIAAPTAVTDDETIKSYDETISIYDTPAAVISKLRNSLAQSAGGPRTENRWRSQPADPGPRTVRSCPPARKKSWYAWPRACSTRR